MSPDPSPVLCFDVFNPEDHLRRKLKNAKIQHSNASDEFWRAARDVSNPDHQRALELAGQARDASTRALLSAVRQLNAFLLHGTVPDELRPIPASNPVIDE